jgi:hypothetical protein
VPRLLPSDVGRMTMRGWRFPQHLRRLEAECLSLLDDPEHNRQLVQMPLRHGKSFYAVWAFVTAYLLSRPSHQVIVATYGKNFSGEWSRKIQNTVRDYGRRLTGVSLGRTRREDFADFAVVGRDGGGGTLRTASPGMAIAGKGAHLIVCDDLVRDMKEAASPSRRNALTTWVNAELLARLEPGGKALAIMSRRHPDDQSGRWLAQNPELPPHQRWRQLTLPAIDDEGRALWPERYSLNELLDIKRRYELDGQSYLWSCLYQQDPRGDSSLIEWPETYFSGIEYDELPPNLPVWKRLLALDPSKGKGDRSGDYSSMPDVTVDTAGVMWVDPWLRVLPAEAVEDEAVARLQTGRYDGIIVETNGFQELVADNIIRKCQAKRVPCPLFKKSSTENKEVRIRLGLGPLLEQKRIRLRRTSSSYRLALQQLREFPSAAHDDFPDSLELTCQLINYLLRGKR